jgi:hypothetical protein
LGHTYQVGRPIHMVLHKKGGNDMATTPQRKGKREGVASELSLFFKIKPGRAENIRQIVKQIVGGPRQYEELERMGTLTEARYVVFDDDTRFAVLTVFEGDWDRYIEDFAPGVLPMWDKIFRDNVEGWFTKPFAEITLDEAKAALSAVQVTAIGFTWMHKDRPLKQILKALRVNEAFQKVLDNPAAQKLLENPALAPLLAEAAE